MKPFLDQLRQTRDEAARAERRHQSAADAATSLAERLRPEYEAACGSFGNPAPEADGLHQRLVAAVGTANREGHAARIEGARRADLDRLLHAPERERTARAALRDARAEVAEAERAVTTAEGALARLRDQHSQELANVALAQRRLTSELVSDLPAAVRNLVAQPVPDDQPQTLSVESHQARADAYRLAIEMTAASLANQQIELAQARDRVQAARQDVFEAVATVAELQHCEALAGYLPAVSKLRGAFEAASLSCQLPDLDRLSRDQIEDAIAEVVSDVDTPVAESLLGRIARKAVEIVQ